MEPCKHDLTIWRGTSYDHEIIAQNKIYTYDPAVNTTKGDLVRTHAENLIYHGFTYEYIDFATDYNDAVFVLRKSWLKDNKSTSEPLLEIDLTSGIEFTDSSVKIFIPDSTIQTFNFETADYELLLYSTITVNSVPVTKVDKFIYGTITIQGDK